MKRLEEIVERRSAIVVLGGRSDRFRERLKMGIELYKEKGNAFLLIVGHDLQADAEAMKMLRKNSDFICENKSVNTYDNAKNSFEIIGALKKLSMWHGMFSEGYRYGGKYVSDVVVVTDAMHMPRAKRYFNRVFGNEFELSFLKADEYHRDIPKKAVYEGIGYLVSFLPDVYINFAKTVKNKYFPWL